MGGSSGPKSLAFAMNIPCLLTNEINVSASLGTGINDITLCKHYYDLKTKKIFKFENYFKYPYTENPIIIF